MGRGLTPDADPSRRPRSPQKPRCRTASSWCHRPPFGLWDAVRFTADPEAERLLRGAAATMRRYVHSGVRQTFWISNYCLTHGMPDYNYHAYVAQQMLTLQAITGNPDWARFSDRFRDDYPQHKVKGTVMFAAGVVTGQKFDSLGKVITTRVLRLSQVSQASVDRRERILGRGYNYRITAGALAGYYVAETYPTVSLPGIFERTAYPYPRVVTFPAGKVTAYIAHERTGALASARTGTFSRPSQAHFDRSGWIGGGSWSTCLTARSPADGRRQESSL